jgi:hypothetical protein
MRRFLLMPLVDLLDHRAVSMVLFGVIAADALASQSVMTRNLSDIRHFMELWPAR